jgi:hypothetical protein
MTKPDPVSQVRVPPPTPHGPYHKSPTENFDRLARAYDRATADMKAGWGFHVEEGMRSLPVFFVPEEATPHGTRFSTPIPDHAPFDDFLIVSEFMATHVRRRSPMKECEVGYLFESVTLDPKSLGFRASQWHAKDGSAVLPEEVEIHSPDGTTSGRVQEWNGEWEPGEIIPEHTTSTIEMMLTHVIGALTMLASPSHHIVIESPRRVRPSDSPKIPRSHERPRCILIKPNEVHKIYKHTGDESATLRTIAPHARRGYSKTLRAERYGDNKGKVIHVRPTWVGPGEWETAGRKYRIVP